MFATFDPTETVIFYSLGDQKISIIMPSECAQGEKHGNYLCQRAVSAVILVLQLSLFPHKISLSNLLLRRCGSRASYFGKLQ